MAQVARGLDLLSEEARDRMIKEIIAFFQDERSEEIGEVAAREVLDFFLERMAPEIYNQAIEDGKGLLRKQLDGLEVEFDLLKRQG